MRITRASNLKLWSRIKSIIGTGHHPARQTPIYQFLLCDSSVPSSRPAWCSLVSSPEPHQEPPSNITGYSVPFSCLHAPSRTGTCSDGSHGREAQQSYSKNRGLTDVKRQQACQSNGFRCSGNRSTKTRINVRKKTPKQFSGVNVKLNKIKTKMFFVLDIDIHLIGMYLLMS